MKTRTEISNAKEERAALWTQAKEINEKAKAEKRDLSAEEIQEFDRLDAEIERKGNEIRVAEKALGLDAEFSRENLDVDKDTELDDEMREKKAPKTYAEWRAAKRGPTVLDKDEYRMAFYQWMAEGNKSLDAEESKLLGEGRVLSKASAGAGLNLVPTEFARTLLDVLREFGVMRQISRILTTDAGEAMQVPTVTSHGTAAWVAENAAYVASDEVFGQSTLNAYKAGTLIKVSEELLTDSAFDLEGYIRDEFGNRIGILENTGYISGDGTGKPTGVTTQASAGVVAASATAITADELMDLFHSLLRPYRRNAVFLMRDSTVKLIRKLKTGVSGDNTYLWQPGLQAGEPDTLLGRPVLVDPDMPAATTGLVSVLFGDFRYYWIRDVNGIFFQRLDELYAENGQVGFRAYHRTDGKLLNTAAVKKLTQL